MPRALNAPANRIMVYALRGAAADRPVTACRQGVRPSAEGVYAGGLGGDDWGRWAGQPGERPNATEESNVWCYRIRNSNTTTRIGEPAACSRHGVPVFEPLQRRGAVPRWAIADGHRHDDPTANATRVLSKPNGVEKHHVARQYPTRDLGTFLFRLRKGTSPQWPRIRCGGVRGTPYVLSKPNGVEKHHVARQYPTRDLGTFLFRLRKGTSPQPRRFVVRRTPYAAPSVATIRQNRLARVEFVLLPRICANNSSNRSDQSRKLDIVWRVGAPSQRPTPSDDTMTNPSRINERRALGHVEQQEPAHELSPFLGAKQFS